MPIANPAGQCVLTRSMLTEHQTAQTAGGTYRGRPDVSGILGCGLGRGVAGGGALGIVLMTHSASHPDGLGVFLDIVPPEGSVRHRRPGYRQLQSFIVHHSQTLTSVGGCDDRRRTGNPQRDLAPAD
jgi:hypothetical protein